jgi:hypothetical protein
MQPQKLLWIVRCLQGLERGGRINLLALFAGSKTKTVKQAKQIGILMAVVDAVVLGGSQRKRL